MSTYFSNTRLRFLLMSTIMLATLPGCCDPGGVPVPVGGRVPGEIIMTTKSAIPDADSVSVPPVSDPNTSGPHQTNIVITTKRGARAISKDDVKGLLSKDGHTLTLTIHVPGVFEPKQAPQKDAGR